MFDAPIKRNVLNSCACFLCCLARNVNQLVCKRMGVGFRNVYIVAILKMWIAVIQDDERKKILAALPQQWLLQTVRSHVSTLWFCKHKCRIVLWSPTPFADYTTAWKKQNTAKGVRWPHSKQLQNAGQLFMSKVSHIHWHHCWHGSDVAIATYVRRCTTLHTWLFTCWKCFCSSRR